MKRFSTISKVVIATLSILIVPPAICTAIVVTTEPKINVSYIDYETLYESISDDTIINKYASKAVNKSLPIDSLLFGDKSVNDGNYVLMLGSNMCDSCCKFFGEFDNPEQSRLVGDWYKSNSIFISVIDETKKSDVDKELINFGLFSVIDQFDGKFYDNKNHQIFFSRGNEQSNTNVGPWEKWTDESINQTKWYNRSNQNYDWDTDSVSTNDYIRNDASAVAFRSINNLGATLYPKDEKGERQGEFNILDDQVMQIVTFTNGNLVDIKSISASDKVKRETFKGYWADIIKKYFVKDDSPL